MLKGAVTDSDHITETGLYFAFFSVRFFLIALQKYIYSKAAAKITSLDNLYEPFHFSKVFLVVPL